MYQSPSESFILIFFKIRHFLYIYSLYFHLCVKKWCSDELQYVLPDILFKSKKEYQNSVGWVLFCFVSFRFVLFVVWVFLS